MKYIVTAVLITIQFSVSAQQFNYINYFRLTSAAKYQLSVGNVDSTLKLLQKAFDKAPFVYGYDEVIYAKCMYDKGRIDSCQYSLESAVSKGFSISFLDSKAFPAIFSDSAKVKNLQKANKQFDAQVNSKLVDSCLYYMWNEEYYYDVFYGYTDEKEMLLGHARRYIDTTIGSHDKLEERFLAFILANGWPSYRRVGIDYLLPCGAHLSFSRLQKLVPFLDKELESGYITPDEYGFIKEKVFINEEGKSFQFYYKPAGYSCGKCITDWTSILKHRDAVGMSVTLDGFDYVPNGWNERTRIPQ